MKQRNLGKSGLLVSQVGLGCNNFRNRLDMAGTRTVVAAALDLGITFFDTADGYARPHPGRSEDYLGTVLGAERKRIILASKFGGAGWALTPEDLSEIDAISPPPPRMVHV